MVAMTNLEIQGMLVSSEDQERIMITNKGRARARDVMNKLTPEDQVLVYMDIKE